MNFNQFTSIIKIIPESALNQILIELKDFINVIDNNGDTPLIWACYNELESIALKLIEKGADVNAINKNGDTSLLWAVRNNLESVTLKLIEKGADINVKNKDGKTPLILAILHQRESIALKLIEKGADVNAIDKYNNTPLIQAIRNNLESLAWKLIEKGADINAKDNSGNTSLILAAYRRYISLTLKLIEKGADINAIDDFNKSAKDYIKEKWLWSDEKRALDLIELKNKPVNPTVLVAETVKPEATVVQGATYIFTTQATEIGKPEVKLEAKPAKYPFSLSLADYLHQNNIPYKVESGFIIPL